jgi:signal recognition particle receptor subunit beta
MTPMQEIKLLFAGPMGAGKTTAIAAISDAPPVSTEVGNLDQAQCAKASTTVGLDFGQTRLPGGEYLRLFGLPGQARFDFMWEALAEGALGVVLLLDNSRPEPLADLALFVERLSRLAERWAMVVGIGRMSDGSARITDFHAWLHARGLRLPVFAVDVRRREDVVVLLEALVRQIEAREELA